MNERDFLIALSSYIYFGPNKVNLLTSYFGSAKKAFEAQEKDLRETGISPSLLGGFISYRRKFNFDTFYKRIEACGAKVITILDKDYPENLRDISDAPVCIYFRGGLIKTDKNAIAIVGSRMMTDYGKEISKKFAEGLSEKGLTIVSGLAFGVDLEVHKSVLAMGGRCIAVLASGIDKITPRSNEWLGNKILEKGGAIVSEYPPGVIPQKYFFPYRNRIISGLSKGVLVIEGMIKSGTIHTARHAAEQGRSVFAVPGDITSPLSAAPLYLIKSGAIPVTGVEDILDEITTS